VRVNSSRPVCSVGQVFELQQADGIDSWHSCWAARDTFPVRHRQSAQGHQGGGHICATYSYFTTIEKGQASTPPLKKKRPPPCMQTPLIHNRHDMTELNPELIFDYIIMFGAALLVV
jgi:hypothetical protein